jgi:streptogrisin C
MNRRAVGTIICASVLAVALGAGTPNASAQNSAGDPAPTEMLAALQRDLHLTADQAITRLAKEGAASRVEQQLQVDLGAGFGGAWLAEDDQRLIVAITDPGLAERVRARGAQPRLVTRSAAQLDTLMTRLDAVPAPSVVSSWYVDTPTNTVVIQALPGAVAAARDFAGAAGLDATSVRVETTASRPVPFADVSGGEEYRSISSFDPSCSVGFSVVGGFVTAGHCGAAGVRVFGRVTGGWEVKGEVAGSTYPGRDYAWVDVNSLWTPRPWVKYYSSHLPVYNANVAAQGASVCRSGSATGWRCGTIKARNVTLNLSEGPVSGLTRTSACANHGDSGGPFMSGGQAQGVLSAGPANDEPAGCFADTFFQPLRPILANYRLNLLVVGGSLPTITTMFCQYNGSNNFSCQMNYVAQGSAQLTWKVGGAFRPAWNNLTAVSGSCGPTTATGISATVTNSAGSWTETKIVQCLGVPQ